MTLPALTGLQARRFRDAEAVDMRQSWFEVRMKKSR